MIHAANTNKNMISLYIYDRNMLFSSPVTRIWYQFLHFFTAAK